MIEICFDASDGNCYRLYKEKDDDWYVCNADGITPKPNITISKDFDEEQAEIIARRHVELCLELI